MKGKRSKKGKKYRMCIEKERTVMHILNECSKLAQTEYK